MTHAVEILPASKDQVQGRLLLLATAFVVLLGVGLTISPAARLRTWEVNLRWDHWFGVLAWLASFYLAHRETARRLPERDPFLLPAAALLSGWGLLVTWRLMPGFGMRQSLWLMLAIGLLLLGLRLPSDLSFLRRYKYIWLTGGLALTGLTLLFGVHPSGGDFPRLWLGCCGLYLQPSEPLKLLLIVYLAAYLAGGRASSKGQGALPLTSARLLPLLAPTLMMLGVALVLLLAQRDLGTASIFLFIYAVVVYVASGHKRLLALSAASMLLAGLTGYLLFDVVQLRIDAWLNPWLDPSGRSYQIVQSLLAVANGGLLGRGPGLGNPGLVPVPHSDFIFASISEEFGLVGATGLLLVVGLMAARGVRAAIYAPDSYRRYLAAGLAAYLGAQTILIVGGNLRLLPLTGVTLPFVSYGGSSLVTSFLSLLLLLHISGERESRPAPLREPGPYLQLGALILAGLAATTVLAGWWAVYRGPALLERTDNPRRPINDRYVRRGAILERDNSPLNLTTGTSGQFTRQSLYPASSNILGYTHPVFGQAGLEASIDPYLRGLQGNPGLTIWWHHLLYGQPPPGLDVRTSLDVDLQTVADEGLAGHTGAAVLLDARSGEILAMASHPGFDANELDRDWERLIQDPDAPLLNRATQGLYSPGPALGPLLLAALSQQGGPPELPADLSYELQSFRLECALEPNEAVTWDTAVAGGCPGAVAALGAALGEGRLISLFQALGLFDSPQVRLPVAAPRRLTALDDPAAAALGQGLQVSPLQMALAAAVLSSGGQRPAPVLVTAIDTPQAGWVPLAALGEPQQAIDPLSANLTAGDLALEGEVWQAVSTALSGQGEYVTWYLGGTLPEWGGRPVVVAVVLEEQDPALAVRVGQALLRAGTGP